MGDVGNIEQPPRKSESIFLQIIEKPDGSVTRPVVPLSPPVGEDQKDAAVFSKDVPLNPIHNTWVRIYRPNLPSSTTQKLPIILFFHGGGFVLFSPASIFYHEFCVQISNLLPAVVISLDYRLSPENRLPAAYDDAIEALLWVQSQANDPSSGDPWIINHGDFSRLFLIGSSSGGNMVYHAALRAAALDLEPIKLIGLVFNQPFFGGEERTQSEIGSDEDLCLPLRACDLMWRLTLPAGANRDHEYCNSVRVPPPHGEVLARCFVKGWKGDPLIDRQREFVKMLEQSGVNVVANLEEDGFHAIEVFDPAKAQSLYAQIKHFVCPSSS